eukprot:Gb_20682 [translate_table: standard]
MAHALQNQKKMILVVGLMVNLEGGKCNVSVLRVEGSVTYSSTEDVRNLCKKGKKKALSEGKLVHTHIAETGFLPEIFIQNTLLNMYAKCGSLVEARRVFDQMPEQDVFSWTAMIAAYARQGYAKDALTLFYRVHRTGIEPDQFIFASVLPACDNLKDLKDIHEEIIKSVKPNLKTFASVLPACTSLADLEQGMEIHEEIIKSVKPDTNTYTSVLPACASLAALEQAIEIHEAIVASGFQSDVCVTNALVDMYAKCGNIENARDVFDNMPQRDVVSWTGMIGAYAMHGYGKEALKLFEEMQHSGTNPNHVTLICVLSACCHAGLVEEGRQYFDCMRQCYHITPSMEHYSCMVDLLGVLGTLMKP